MDDELIDRLLAGPIDAELSAREMAVLEATLSIRQPLATFARSDFQQRREKLRAILKFNRILDEQRKEKELEHPELFTVKTVDVPQLLQTVERLLFDLEKYEEWIGRWGHQSIASAELLVNALDDSYEKLRNTVIALRLQYEASTGGAQPGLFGILKSLEEISRRIGESIPNDPDVEGHDEPFFVRLSAHRTSLIWRDYTSTIKIGARCIVWLGHAADARTAKRAPGRGWTNKLA